MALVILAVAATYWLTLSIWRSADFDVPEYAQYAQAFWTAQPRLSALPREYPPLVIVAFSLALLPGSADVRAVFGVWMGVAFLAGYLGLRRFSTHGSALRFAVYMLLGAQGVLLARYDLLPALATLGALWATRHRRFTLAYVLLAVGIALKLYPALLLPVVMIEQWRVARNPIGPGSGDEDGARWRAARRVGGGAALCLGFAALPFVGALWRDGAGAFSVFGYALARPAQIESVAATLGWVGTLVGIPATHFYSFLSDNYAGPLVDGASWGLGVTLLAGCVVVYRLRLLGRLGLEQAFLICLCLIVLTSKVFSTQYLIWVLPFAAEVGGYEAIWILICLLTFVDYPLFYPFNHPIYTSTEVTLFLALLALRNGLFVFVTARILLRPQVTGTKRDEANARDEALVAVMAHGPTQGGAHSE